MLVLDRQCWRALHVTGIERERPSLGNTMPAVNCASPFNGFYVSAISVLLCTRQNVHRRHFLMQEIKRWQV